jgi:hypothetical protein
MVFLGHTVSPPRYPGLKPGAIDIEPLSKFVVGATVMTIINGK